jgi:hypothetical protein
VRHSKPAPKRIRKAALFAGVAFVIAAAVGILVLGKTLTTPHTVSFGSDAVRSSSNGVSSLVGEGGNPGTPAALTLNSLPSTSPPLPSVRPTSDLPLDSNALSLIVVGTESKPNDKAGRQKAVKRAQSVLPKTDVAPIDTNGFLFVNVHPWAEVVVDGESKGTSPIQQLPLASGPHTVRLENNVLGYVETKHIVIQPGKALVLTLDAQRKLEPSSDE